MTSVNKIRLRELLEQRRRSAREVSLAANLGASAVRDLLNGKSRDPGLGTLAAIAGELGVDVAEIVVHENGNESGLSHFPVAPRFFESPV